MKDQFNRTINYLRISVTDRCNLRCRYCMPEEGVELVRHNDILSFEEIFRVANVAVGMGVDKIRLTGGEPLVRKGIVNLVGMLSSINGIKDLSMTTNGILLSKFAHALAAAGLDRVNISLDTLNPQKYHYITRFGNLNDVLEGIEAAKNAGLKPIKINCVVTQNSSEPDARLVAQFCRNHGLQVRFIHQMNLDTGEFHQVEGGSGGDCRNCNRLRLTANGKIKPCLFSDDEYDVRLLGVEKAILMALNKKPFCGTNNHIGHFYNIGG
jgi:GTP 3',8-cyclase